MNDILVDPDNQIYLKEANVFSAYESIPSMSTILNDGSQKYLNTIGQDNGSDIDKNKNSDMESSLNQILNGMNIMASTIFDDVRNEFLQIDANIKKAQDDARYQAESYTSKK